MIVQSHKGGRLKLATMTGLVWAGMVVIGGSATAASQVSRNTAGSLRDPAFAISEETDGSLQLTLTRSKFTSRDQLEGDLLRRAAQVTRQRGQDWFLLLHLPGENYDHPPRRDGTLGSRYGHWQPHWLYLVPGSGWQPWHPEWGAAFWTTTVDPATVEQFQVHAMIKLGRGRAPDEETAFDAKRTLEDIPSTLSR